MKSAVLNGTFMRAPYSARQDRRMTDLRLQRGDQRAVVSTTGGRLVGWSVAGREILAGHENPDRFAYRGALLAPWPNRVAGGRWTWKGRELQLPVNDPDTGAALHGLVYDKTWDVERADEHAVSLTYALPSHPGYPFPLQLRASYELGEGGLACSLTAANTGDDAAPVGLGVHPYIAAPGPVDELVVTIPADTLLETDDAWQEAGRLDVEVAGTDFRSGRRLGSQELDAAFTDVRHDGTGRTETCVELPGGPTVLLWSGSSCRWWLLYTGHTLPPPDFRRSIAVEPMTCPPNALNSGEVDILEPGAELRLDWGFELR
jgi:aldose 1-epimerase